MSEAGYAEWASTTHLGASGSGAPEGSSLEMAGVKGAESTETTRKRGDTGSIEMSSAKIGKEDSKAHTLRLTTPVSLRPGKKVAATEPIQLRVYQRSRGRILKPTQVQTAPWMSGQPSGQLTSRGILGVTLFVSPVRLNFDGVEEESRESGANSSSAGILGTTPNSLEIVLELGIGGDSSLARILGVTSNNSEIVHESVNGANSSGMGMSGASSVEAEELKLALEVGGIVGLTCEGQIGHLQEVLG